MDCLRSIYVPPVGFPHPAGTWMGVGGWGARTKFDRETSTDEAPCPTVSITVELLPARVDQQLSWIRVSN